MGRNCWSFARVSGRMHRAHKYAVRCDWVSHPRKEDIAFYVFSSIYSFSVRKNLIWRRMLGRRCTELIVPLFAFVNLASDTRPWCNFHVAVCTAANSFQNPDRRCILILILLPILLLR